MGLADAFGKEDRAEITMTQLFKLMKESAKGEIMFNAVKCDVPHRYIRECMTGEKESDYNISLTNTIQCENKEITE